MAITNTVRAWNSFILNVNTDPTVLPGASAGIGSLAIRNNGDIYYKTGAADTAWTLSATGGLQKGTKTIICIDNGDYATGQDAINAASAGDIILFGAKSGGWGNIVIPAQKSLSIFALQAPKAKEVIFGTISFSPGAGTAQQNEVYLANLYISSGSGNCFTFTGTAPARIRMSGCLLSNGGSNPTVTVANSGVGSSCYFENCYLLASDAVPVQFSISGTYSKIYYCTVDRGSVGLNASSAVIESVETAYNVDVAGPIINLTSSATFSSTLSLFRNTTTNGSGISLDGTSTIIDSNNIYSIATGTGYCLLGTGNQLYGPIITSNSLATPANVNIQNTITRLPLTLALTPTP